MADYRKEIKKLKKHRERYRPAMAMILRLYRTAKPSEFPIELIDHEKVLTILELIDVGYLAEDAFIIRRRFNSIASLRYGGAHPFTEGGEMFFYGNQNFIAKIVDAIRRRRC